MLLRKRANHQSYRPEQYQYTSHDLSASQHETSSKNHIVCTVKWYVDPSRARENIHCNKKHFGTRWKSFVAYRLAFYTPDCTRSHEGLAPCEIISREIWERFQLIHISTVWQLKSNHLKRAKSGRKRVVKEMITGSLSLPFSFFPPHQLFACLFLLRLPHYLRVWNRLVCPAWRCHGA